MLSCSYDLYEAAQDPLAQDSFISMELRNIVHCDSYHAVYL